MAVFGDGGLAAKPGSALCSEWLALMRQRLDG